MAYFSEGMLSDLKRCIQRLYDRDRRLNLFPKDFWIVDKALSQRID